MRFTLPFILLMIVALTGCMEPNTGTLIKNDGTNVRVTAGVPMQAYGSAPAENEQKPTLIITEQFHGSTTFTRYIMRDATTGVDYIVIQSGNGIVITPRLGNYTQKLEKEAK